MNTLLPPALAGAGYAAILAVIMSTVDSLLVGGSTIIHRALFQTNTDEKKALTHARLMTALFGIIGFTLAFLIPQIVTLSLIVTYLALIFVPPIFAALYSKKISANASFYSLLVPTLLLFILFPIVKENTFVITTLVGVLMIIFFDKLFRRKGVVLTPTS